MKAPGPCGSGFDTRAGTRGLLSLCGRRAGGTPGRSQTVIGQDQPVLKQAPSNHTGPVSRTAAMRPQVCRVWLIAACSSAAARDTRLIANPALAKTRVKIVANQTDLICALQLASAGGHCRADVGPS